MRTAIEKVLSFITRCASKGKIKERRTMESRLDLDFTMPLLLIASCLYAFLHYLLHKKQDPLEPPTIPQHIPYVGHLLSLIRHGTGYYAQVR